MSAVLPTRDKPGGTGDAHSSRPPPPSSSRPAPSSRKPATTVRSTIDFALMTPASRVMEELLVLRPNERIVIAHDGASAEIALAFEHAANEGRARTERIDLEQLAPRPWVRCPELALTAVRDAAATILALRYEDGEYDARHAFVTAAIAARARHVHMIGVSRRAFTASMTAPVARITELLDALKGAMRPTSRLSVRSAAGTNVEIEMAPHLRWFSNGSAVRAAHWINVPHGGLVTSPGSVNGVYVADASMGGASGARAGFLASRPIRMVLEGGRVKSVESRDRTLGAHVERFIAEAQGHERVGLLNLGANLGIVSSIGEILHDEHAPGVHLALGDSFGASTGATWSTHGQLSFAIAEADVDLDGVPLIRRGRYVRFV